VQARALLDEFLVQERVVGAAERHRPVAVLEEGEEEPEGGVEHRLLHAAPVERAQPGVERANATELARQLAMHISFAAPEWTTRDDVPVATVETERGIFTNSDEVQSKPEAAREKIVDGMLAKRFFAATPGGVLVDQPWIHDPSKTVGQALEDAGASAARFTRVSVAG